MDGGAKKFGVEAHRNGLRLGIECQNQTMKKKIDTWNWVVVMEPFLLTKLKIDWTLGKIEKTCSQLEQGVCHTMALPFTLKSILSQKKNYENSTISPCKNIIFKKSSKKNQNFNIL